MRGPAGGRAGHACARDATTPSRAEKLKKNKKLRFLFFEILNKGAKDQSNYLASSRRTAGGQTRGVVGSRVAHMWYTNMGVARCYARV